MRFNWKSLRLAIFPALLLLLGSGCGGVNAQRSVSPLDFLIPGGGGLMRGLLYVPPKVEPVELRDTVPQPAEPSTDILVPPIEPTQLLAQVQ